MTETRAHGRFSWLKHRDHQQAFVAFAFLAGAIAFSLFAHNDPKSSRLAGSETAQSPSNEAEIYTGSILFVPLEGDDCRQRLLDNITGRIWDNGVVSCDDALTKSARAQTGRWSAARVDAIRDGFMKK